MVQAMVWVFIVGGCLLLTERLLNNFNISSLRISQQGSDGSVFWVWLVALSVSQALYNKELKFYWRVSLGILVALVFLGSNPEFEVVTQRLADITGSRGNDWHLLTAGAFVSMILPLTVFIALQRYFVRGLMAGSVKG